MSIDYNNIVELVNILHKFVYDKVIYKKTNEKMNI